MDVWLIWLISGVVMILLEFIIPGGIIVFLGIAASIVAGGIFAGWIDSLTNALLTWFITSLFLMIFLRSIFIKYFEGDTSIQNVDEDIDLKGSLVTVVEEVLPHKSGRVKFRDTTWQARSDEEFAEGSSAIIADRDGNVLIIKSI